MIDKAEWRDTVDRLTEKYPYDYSDLWEAWFWICNKDYERLAELIDSAYDGGYSSVMAYVDDVER